MEEPSIETFDRTHLLLDDKGDPLPSLASLPPSSSDRTTLPSIGPHHHDNSSAENAPESVNTGASHKSSLWSGYSVVHSVLLHEGVNYHIDNDDEDLFDMLPRRFEPGSSKARMTWFGALCLAGMGMFVEAYIIITVRL